MRRLYGTAFAAEQLELDTSVNIVGSGTGPANIGQ
jgi:hypothetical protein